MPMGGRRTRPPGGPDQPEGRDLLAFTAPGDTPPPAVPLDPVDTIDPAGIPQDPDAEDP